MKRYLMMLITAIAVMFGGMAFVAPAANAQDDNISTSATEDEPQSCADIDMSSDNGYCIDTYSSEASAKTTDKSVAAVGTKGKILTRYNIAAGIDLKKSERHNRGCKLVQKATQIPVGATCIRGARGFRYKNSGWTQDHVFTTWMDYVGSPGSSTPNAEWMKFVKRGGQWFKAGDQTGAGNCGNKVWFNGHGPKTKLNWRQVINIRSFANWIFKGNVAVKASALAKVQVKAWCRTANTSASGSGSASADSEASASASYKLRGLTKIKQWTNAKEAELTQSQTLTVNAQAKVDAVAKARADAYADAKCEQVQQVTCPEGTIWNDTNGNGQVDEGECTTPPPSTPAPNLIETDTINDVLVNNTRTITVKGSVAPGHTATLIASAKNGGSITQGKTQTVSGNFTVQVTYMAPSEVPGANNGVAAGHDQVAFTLTQDDGQHDSISTNQFVITPRPVTPA